jgi:hypothetical protein
MFNVLIRNILAIICYYFLKGFYAPQFLKKNIISLFVINDLFFFISVKPKRMQFHSLL